MNDTGAPIPSTYADDPDMLEIIELFVDQMPTRIDAIEAAWRDGDQRGLVHAAHQLKGAAAGYGYAAISDVAASIETQLRSLETSIDDSIQSDLSHLLNLCRRIVVAPERVHERD